MARTLFTSRAASYDSSVSTAREELGRTLRLDLQFMEQVHGDRAICVDHTVEIVPECDALITRTPGIGLAVMVADCLPILIDGGDVVAAVHAGRKGIISRIIEKTMSEMLKVSDAPIAAYSAQIGPSICSRCYEVSPEMYHEVIAEFPEAATSPESHSLDLQAVAVRQLISSGLAPSSIMDWGVCTLESSNHFSYRGGDRMERQVGVISL